MPPLGSVVTQFGTLPPARVLRGSGARGSGSSGSSSRSSSSSSSNVLQQLTREAVVRAGKTNLDRMRHAAGQLQRGVRKYGVSSALASVGLDGQRRHRAGSGGNGASIGARPRVAQ
jgi:hypothetical protein